MQISDQEMARMKMQSVQARTEALASGSAEAHGSANVVELCETILEKLEAELREDIEKLSVVRPRLKANEKLKRALEDYLSVKTSSQNTRITDGENQDHETRS